MSRSQYAARAQSGKRQAAGGKRKALSAKREAPGAQRQAPCALRFALRNHLRARVTLVILRLNLSQSSNKSSASCAVGRPKDSNTSIIEASSVTDRLAMFKNCLNSAT